MKSLFLSLLLVVQATAATIYVDASKSYIPAAAAWGADGLPVTPTYMWYFADGATYDKTGAIYDNLGSGGLLTGLSDGQPPGLQEGILRSGQSSVMFDGSNDFIYVNDAGIDGRITGQKASWAVWFRTTTATGTLMEKTDHLLSQREWNLILSGGKLLAQYSDNGTTASPHFSGRSTTATFNDGKWHLAISSYSMPSDSLTLWVDGDSQAVTGLNIGNLAQFYNGTAPMLIGANWENGVFTSSMNASIAWAAIWDNLELTEAQRDAIWAYRPTGTNALEYPSLQSAFHQGTAGDTILVDAGTYVESCSTEAAFDYIGATVTTTTWPVFYGTDLAAGSYGLALGAAAETGFLTFRGYYGAGSIGLLATALSDGSLLHHLEFDSCLTAVDLNGACSNDTLVNCTIDGALLVGGTGVLKDGAAGTVVVQNCVIVNYATGINESTGVINGGYNDFFGNTANYANMAAPSTDVTLNPFLTRGENNYRPQPFSLVLNRGLLTHNGAGAFAPIQAAAIGGWDLAFVPPGMQDRTWARSGWGRGAWGR